MRVPPAPEYPLRRAQAFFKLILWRWKKRRTSIAASRLALAFIVYATLSTIDPSRDYWSSVRTFRGICAGACVRFGLPQPRASCHRNHHGKRGRSGGVQLLTPDRRGSILHDLAKRPSASVGPPQESPYPWLTRSLSRKTPRSAILPDKEPPA